MNQQLTLDKDDNNILQSLESNAADMVLMVIWTAGYIQIYFTVLFIELDYAWPKSWKYVLAYDEFSIQPTDNLATLNVSSSQPRSRVYSAC